MANLRALVLILLSREALYPSIFDEFNTVFFAFSSENGLITKGICEAVRLPPLYLNSLLLLSSFGSTKED